MAPSPARNIFRGDRGLRLRRQASFREAERFVQHRSTEAILGTLAFISVLPDMCAGPDAQSLKQSIRLTSNGRVGVVWDREGSRTLSNRNP